MNAMNSPRHFHFVLLPGFSFLGFGSAVEPLRVSNRFHANAYRWSISSLDGEPVRASNGMTLNVDGNPALMQTADAVLVVAGFDPLDRLTTAPGKALATSLRDADRRGALLGAIDTGAFVLASFGLLGQTKVTVHWEARNAFVEMFPKSTVTEELFEIHKQRAYCAGGTAALDMMLALITDHYSRALAAQVSEQFVLERMRNPSDHQRMQTIDRYKVYNEKLVSLIQMMQDQLDPPLSLNDLATRMNITRRQLERLFAHHLNQSPSKFYLGLRLERARQLLEQTVLGVLDVAIACGFGSTAHFTRTFKAHTGHSPSQYRHTLAKESTPHRR
jgi:AraC family carnitine catabolism transcriptional activator